MAMQVNGPRIGSVRSGIAGGSTVVVVRHHAVNLPIRWVGFDVFRPVHACRASQTGRKAGVDANLRRRPVGEDALSRNEGQPFSASIIVKLCSVYGSAIEQTK